MTKILGFTYLKQRFHYVSHLRAGCKLQEACIVETSICVARVGHMQGNLDLHGNNVLRWFEPVFESRKIWD